MVTQVILAPITARDNVNAAEDLLVSVAGVDQTLPVGVNDITFTAADLSGNAAPRPCVVSVSVAECPDTLRLAADTGKPYRDVDTHAWIAEAEQMVQEGVAITASTVATIDVLHLCHCCPTVVLTMARLYAAHVLSYGVVRFLGMSSMRTAENIGNVVILMKLCGTMGRRHVRWSRFRGTHASRSAPPPWP